MPQLQLSAKWAWASIRRPSATTAISNTVILGAYTVTGVVTARMLGPAGRGQLTFVLLWSGLINTVGSLGLPTSVAYHLARWPNQQSALLAWCKRVAVRQAIILTGVSSIFFWWLYAHYNLPMLLAIEYPTRAASGTITLFGAAYAQGSGNFTRFNGIRLISGAMPALLMAVGTLTLRLTTTEAGTAYLVPVWCSAIVAAIWLRRASRRAAKGALSAQDVRSVWSYGWRNLTSASSLMVNSNSDQFVLGLLVATTSLGVYSVAASVSSPLPIIIASLGMVGLPSVARLTGPTKVSASWKVLRRGVYCLTFITPPIAILLPWAIPWVYGTRYVSAIVPGELLLFGAVFAALAGVTDDLLRAHGIPGFVTVTQGIGGALTIIGTLLLAKHSLTAVAMVSSVGFMVTFALALTRLWAATRRLRVSEHVTVTTHSLVEAIVPRSSSARPSAGSSDSNSA